MDNDISKIVSLILENPQIVEQIRELSQKESKETPNAEDTGVSEETAEPASSYINDSRSVPDGSRRRQLLGALKPYLSSERAKAIDSMMSIAEIIDIARKK